MFCSFKLLSKLISINKQDVFLFKDINKSSQIEISFEILF